MSCERETEEERKEDRERAVALRYQKQRDFIKGGLQLCVVSHRLDSLWTFLHAVLEQRNSGRVERVVGHDLVHVGESPDARDACHMADAVLYCCMHSRASKMGGSSV